MLTGFPSHLTRGQSLTDSELEQLVLELSEPSAYFDTDNLISNEISYLHVIPRMKEVGSGKGAYLGVGPDQNFTYLVHLQPALAIILDVRRDNLLQHLYLKMLMEASADRLDYLSRLFGKPLPRGFERDPEQDASGLARLFNTWSRDSDFFEKNLTAAWLAMRNRFPTLTRDGDRTSIDKIARSFFAEGLQLKYRSHGRPPHPHYPSYESLMTLNDADGQIGHYLNREAHFQFLKRMQSENRVIPVVGDLAGPTALTRIGRYLTHKEHVVSAFYVSNVEFYLFRAGRFGDFMRNLKTLPTNKDSVVVRSYFNYWRHHPETREGYYVTSLLQLIQRFVSHHQDNPYRDYWEVVSRDFISTWYAVKP